MICSVTINKDGHIFGGGYFNRYFYVRMGGDGAALGLTVNEGSDGGRALFISFTSTGDIRFAGKAYVSAGTDIIYDLKSYSDGSVGMVGFCDGGSSVSIYSVGSTAAPLTLPAGSSKSVTIIKYDSSGQYLVATRAVGFLEDGGGSDYGVYLDIHQVTGNAYVVASMTGNTVNIYGSGGELAVTLTHGGFLGMMVASFDAQLRYRWATVAENGQEAKCRAVAVDQLTQEVYVAGLAQQKPLKIYSASNLTTPALTWSFVGYTAIPFLVFDSSGKFMRNYELGSDKPEYEYIRSLAVDGTGNIVAGGIFSGAALNIFETTDGTTRIARTLSGDNAGFAVKMKRGVQVAPSTTTMPSSQIQITLLPGVDYDSSSSSIKSNEDGDQNNNQQNNGSMMAIGITMGSVGLLLVLGAFTAKRMAKKSRRYFHSWGTSAKLITSPSDGESEQPPMIVNMTVIPESSTLYAENYGLAVPAFVEYSVPNDLQVGSLVAEGGLSRIHEVVSISNPRLNDEAHGERLLIKVVATDMDRMVERARQIFLQELALTYHLRDNPHVVQVYGWSKVPAAILMKRYALGDLRAFVRGKGEAARVFHYSKRTVLAIAHQLSMALEDVHRRGFVHCDIKCSNMLLEKNNGSLHAVLSDFGISRILETTSLAAADFKLVKVNGLSMAYASPESILRMKHSSDSDGDKVIWMMGDVYSMGIVLSEMLKRCLWEK